MSENTVATTFDERWKAMLDRVSAIEKIEVRIVREKGGSAHHELHRDPDVRAELVRLLLQLEALAERENAHARSLKELNDLVSSMRAASADAATQLLVDAFAQHGTNVHAQLQPEHRDPIVELTAFFEGAIVNAGDVPEDPDDPTKTRAVWCATEVARAAFGNGVAKPLNAPSESGQLLKNHDNRRRNHGYAKKDESGKQPLWTPERWAQVRFALDSTTVEFEFMH